MNTVFAIALLVVGILLLIFGISSADSFGSHVSRAVAGHPTDKAMWLMIGGAAATVVGLVGLFRGSRHV